MTEQNVLKAVQNIKLKNSEGCDGIPTRILVDGINELIEPMRTLFNNIYAWAVKLEVRGSSFGALVWYSDTVPSTWITSAVKDFSGVFNLLG